MISKVDELVMGSINLMKSNQMMALYGLATFGAWKFMQVVGDVTYGFWKHFLRPRRNLRRRYGSSNSSITPWAVVTGGADGIGKAYCQELASAGFNLIVIDKNANGLEKMKSSMGVEVETICYDFANLGTEEGQEKLEQEIKAVISGKDVAILINNVAEFQEKKLVDSHWSYVLRASNVNSHSYAAMAIYFIPVFLARYEQGLRSAIINVGTCAAEPQNPRYQFSIYGATKAYGHILSSSLHEMYSDKIDVMTVIPRQTETKMNPAGYLFTCQPETHAKAVFDQIGYETQTYGVMIHDLEYNLRFKYTVLGLFDKFVQWRNASRNANLVKIYGKRN